MFLLSAIYRDDAPEFLMLVQQISRDRRKYSIEKIIRDHKKYSEILAKLCELGYSNHLTMVLALLLRGVAIPANSSWSTPHFTAPFLMAQERRLDTLAQVLYMFGGYEKLTRAEKKRAADIFGNFQPQPDIFLGCLTAAFILKKDSVICELLTNFAADKILFDPESKKYIIRNLTGLLAHAILQNNEAMKNQLMSLNVPLHNTRLNLKSLPLYALDAKPQAESLRLKKQILTMLETVPGILAGRLHVEIIRMYKLTYSEDIPAVAAFRSYLRNVAQEKGINLPPHSELEYAPHLEEQVEQERQEERFFNALLVYDFAVIKEELDAIKNNDVETMAAIERTTEELTEADAAQDFFERSHPRVTEEQLTEMKHEFQYAKDDLRQRIFDLNKLLIEKQMLALENRYIKLAKTQKLTQAINNLFLFLGIRQSHCFAHLLQSSHHDMIKSMYDNGCSSDVALFPLLTSPNYVLTVGGIWADRLPQISRYVKPHLSALRWRSLSGDMDSFLGKHETRKTEKKLECSIITQVDIFDYLTRFLQPKDLVLLRSVSHQIKNFCNFFAIPVEIEMRLKDLHIDIKALNHFKETRIVPHVGKMSFWNFQHANHDMDDHGLLWNTVYFVCLVVWIPNIILTFMNPNTEHLHGAFVAATLGLSCFLYLSLKYLYLDCRNQLPEGSIAILSRSEQLFIDNSMDNSQEKLVINIPLYRISNFLNRLIKKLREEENQLNNFNYNSVPLKDPPVAREMIPSNDESFISIAVGDDDNKCEGNNNSDRQTRDYPAISDNSSIIEDNSQLTSSNIPPRRQWTSFLDRRNRSQHHAIDSDAMTPLLGKTYPS